MGLGTTELSPELTEKVARLERDNAQLRAAANRSGLESVLAMENEVDDAKRLAATFEVSKTTPNLKKKQKKLKARIHLPSEQKSLRAV